MNRSSHKKNKRYDSEDSDPQSQSNSSDSNQDGKSANYHQPLIQPCNRRKQFYGRRQK